MSALLTVTDLRVQFDGSVTALRGVSFTLARGESLAVVGESGAGKSTLAQCLAGLRQPPEVTGSVQLDGEELVGAASARLRVLRGPKVALCLQGAPFNPVSTLAEQLAEPLLAHGRLRPSQARDRVAQLAAECQLDPALLARYPHQVSGGQRRRAALVAALVLDPELLVLDEPTGGLDPETSHRLVAEIGAQTRSRGCALLVVTHDLAAAVRLSERTLVLYGGSVLETGPSAEVIGDPNHPYTWALTNAYPAMSSTKELRPIRGAPPDPADPPAGCPFHPRCPQAVEVCREQPAPLTPVAAEPPARAVACHLGGVRTLLAVRGVSKQYGRGRRAQRVLDEVSLDVRQGEAVGLVGPSGSGKSTLALIASGHLTAEAGEIDLLGEPLPTGRSRADRHRRARVQLVMQDPWDALSPRLTVAEQLGEPLALLGSPGGDPAGGDPAEQIAGALSAVGLPTSARFLGAYPHQLSGGQLQRIALARALITEPAVLLADEPTSMLDPSEQARLLVTLRERQSELGLGLLFISHDLALVRKVTDRVVVLDHGRVVESARTELLCAAPRSPTTRRLLAAAPTLLIPPSPVPSTSDRTEKEQTDVTDESPYLPARQRAGGGSGGALADRVRRPGAERD
ncbi:ABC transporter ATP-binding protein [Natronosporangium hydrolyticum]|uniref:ABC transporter ATP-binding protein n=1 Tax=Natronosporangium hydrolyticum TaxID=2811111 RepID=A0A895YEY4_9ACTN|nr:ABC transporter ATP-binding protein [Natronosporangium hydrolyticum]QSB13973.1 ABC transporter ATP-binding protein [Natronosporangium hydrolyticum]